MKAKAREARWAKLLCVFAFIILFVLTNSRSGFIAVGGLLLPLLMLTPNWQVRLRLMTAVLAVGVLLSFVIFPALGARGGLGGLWDIIVRTYESTVSMEGRVGAFDEARKVFLMSPIFGVGIGNYHFYIGAKYSGAAVATIGNLYFNILTEVGIVGGILFSGFMASILVGLVKVLRRSDDLDLRGLAFAAVVSIAGVMVSSIASSGLYTDTYLWVMWGMAVVITRLHSNRGLRGVEPPVR
ncbi:MAG: O-antigen ligase family protein [Candidatus Binatia bacterium]